MKFKSHQKPKSDPEIREVGWILLICFSTMVFLALFPYMSQQAQPLRFLDGIIPLAYAEDQNIIIIGDETVVRQSGTGTSCPTLTGPASATFSGTQLVHWRDSSANGCDFPIYTIDRTTTTQVLIPEFFNDFLTSFGVISDPLNIGEFTSACRFYEVSEQGVDARLNASAGYEVIQGRNQNIAGSMTYCDTGGTAPIFLNSGTSNYIDSLAINSTYFQWGINSLTDDRAAASENDVDQNAYLKLTFTHPPDKDITTWMMQEHPKFPSSTIDGGFFGIDDITFTMDSNTLDDTDIGQAVIFKEFNKTQVSGIGFNVTGANMITDPVDAESDAESFNGQDSNGKGIFISPNGTKFYLLGDDGDDVNEYNLNTAWNVTTKTFQQTFSVSTETTTPNGIFFRNDGLKMYVLSRNGGNGGEIHEYDLSNAWDVSSATLNQSVADLDKGTPTDIWFDENGKRLYLATGVGGNITQYDVSTSWDISTISEVQAFDITTELDDALSVWFNPLGTTMLVTGNDGVDNPIVSYTLSTAWDISTSIFVTKRELSFSVFNIIQDTTFSQNGTKMYALDQPAARVAQYELAVVESSNSVAPNVRITGGYQAQTAAGDMWVRIEVKDGSYGTQTLDSFPEDEYDIYQSGGSLGAIHLEPVDTSVTPFDVSFSPNWSNSTEETFTVFIGVDDNSTSGSLIANVTSFELDEEIKYDFEDINSLEFYETSIELDSDPDLRVGANDYDAGILNITSVTTTGVTGSVLPTPIAPTGGFANATSGSTIDLTWKHNLLNVTDFLIIRNDTKLTDTNNIDLNYTDTGLLSDTTYEYEVCAVNGDSVSTCTTMSASTSGPPPPPADVDATADLDTVIVNWTAVITEPEVDRYWIERGFDINGTWQFREFHASGNPTIDARCNIANGGDGVLLGGSDSGSAISDCQLLKVFPRDFLNNSRIQYQYDFTHSSSSSGLSGFARVGVTDTEWDVSDDSQWISSGLAYNWVSNDPNDNTLIDGQLTVVGGGEITDDIVDFASDWDEIDTEFSVVAFEMHDGSILTQSPTLEIKWINITDFTTGNQKAFFNFSSPSISKTTRGNCDDSGGGTPENCDYGTATTTAGSTENFEVIASVEETQTLEQTGTRYKAETTNTSGSSCPGVNNAGPNTLSPIEMRLSPSNSILDCQRMGVEWDISEIPEGSTVTNVTVTYNVQTVTTGTRTCDWRSLENQISALPSNGTGGQAFWDDIGNGTLFVSSDTDCQVVANDYTINVPAFISDIQNNIDNNEGWWGVGQKFSSETRQVSTTHRSELTNMRLTVEYNSTTYIDDTVERGVEYRYRVFAENSIGNGTGTESNTVLTNDLPAIVQNVETQGEIGPQINVQWDALPFNSGEGDPSTGLNLTKYQVFRQNVTAGTPFELLTELFASSPPPNFYNDTTVTTGHTFSYIVSACNLLGCNENSTASTFIFPDEPLTPQNFTAIANGTSVTLDWLSDDNATDYFVKRNGTEIANPTVSFYEDPLVPLDTLFNYSAFARGLSGNSSEAWQLVITNDLPTAPLNLTGAMGTVIPDLEDVFLDWEEEIDNGTGSPSTGTPIINYTVERKQGLGSFGFLANVSGGIFEYEDETVISGANYTYRVKGVNVVGDSPYSNTFSIITTPLTPPNAPENLTATTISGTEIDLDWDAPSTGDPPTDYVIQRRHVGFTGFITIVTVPAPTTEYGDSGLTPGNTYDYRVRADNGAGSSGYSNIAQNTTFTVPSAPQNLEANTLNDTAIFVNWDEPATPNGEIQNYTLDLESPVGGGFGLLTTINGNITNFTATGLTTKTEYNFRVNATNLVGTSAYSNEASNTTFGVPGPPINLGFDTNGVSTITVDWDEPINNFGSEVTGYRIDQAEGIGGTFVTAIADTGDNTEPLEETFVGLLQETNYIYRIAGINGFGLGDFSANLTAGTFVGPSEPENFFAVFNSTKPYSVFLSWDEPLNDGGKPIAGYLIERKDTIGVFQLIANITDPSIRNYTDTSLLNLATHTYRVAAYTNPQGSFTPDQDVTTFVPANIVNFTINDFTVVGDILEQEYSFVVDDCFPDCTLTQADIERNGIVESNYVLSESVPLDTEINFTTYFVIPESGSQSINTTAIVTNLGGQGDDEAGVVTTELQFVTDVLFFNHTRINDFEDISFNLTRKPVPWDVTCEHTIGSTLAIPNTGISGTQDVFGSDADGVFTDIGLLKEILDANPTSNSYVSCFDPADTQILAFTSFGLGNGTLALTAFTDQLGDFMGVPVPFIFIIFLAAIWTGRSASTGIIFLAVAIGTMGVLGYFDVSTGNPVAGSLEAFWGLIVALTLMGAFIGKRFF